MDKLQELRQELEATKVEIRELLDADKVDEAEEKVEKKRKIEKKIKLQVELDADEVAKAIELAQEKEEEKEEDKQDKEDKKEDEQRSEKGDIKMEKRTAFINTLRGVATQEERALVQEGVGQDGGYLVPTEEKTTIEEFKRSYKSAKDLVNVTPVGSLSGSYVVEEGSPVELQNFDEDNAGLDDTKVPTFASKEWKVDAYGAIVPMSNTFRQDETGSFMTYLNRYFAKRAVLTENAKIFEALKAGKTAKAIKGIDEIKTALNKDLDASIASGAIVVTNQTGFDILDRAKDSDSNYLLQDNPTQETPKMLAGKAVHVFSDAQLKNVGAKAPMFVGDMEEAINFMDRQVYEVAISGDAGFNKNQSNARVIERFDVVTHDTDAYVHLQITEAVATPESK